MMEAILTNARAQRIIDFVSPIYGQSYVGLWIYQAIGSVLDEVYAIAEQLRTETNASSADLLLNYWEEHYGIPVLHQLSSAQRQANLIAKIQERGPCNPTRLAAAVSASLGGAEVDITENIAKNTFLVNIREVVEDITPAIAVLERKKPAHLIYQIRVATQMVAETELKIAIAMTHAEMFKVEVNR